MEIAGMIKELVMPFHGQEALRKEALFCLHDRGANKFLRVYYGNGKEYPSVGKFVKHLSLRQKHITHTPKASYDRRRAVK